MLQTSRIPINYFETNSFEVFLSCVPYAAGLRDANTCGSKWVDKVKPDGSLKSRLVVQGFTQVWLKDYHDTFSAFASMTTFRMFINVTAS